MSVYFSYSMYADLVDDDALHREILQIDLGIGDRSYGVASNPHLPGYMLVTEDVEVRPDGQNVEYQGQIILINVMSPVLGEFTSILDLHLPKHVQIICMRTHVHVAARATLMLRCIALDDANQPPFRVGSSSSIAHEKQPSRSAVAMHRLAKS